MTDVRPSRSPRQRESAAWPVLPSDTWSETLETLHRWTQIVGKIRLKLSPKQNHFWHSALYVSQRGLTTSPVPYGSELFQIDFDFINHVLTVDTSWGRSDSVALRPRSVADFYSETIAMLFHLGVDVRIWTRPMEIVDPIPFEQDTRHASYDAEAVHALWRALVQADRVFIGFRGAFLGKSSPVHFFWGSFDLAVTRFSGRRAPMWNGQAFNVHPHVMHESYSHEVSSAGLWLGNATAPPTFYSYAVPEPTGFGDARVSPEAATYDTSMGEFVLPYEAVRTSEQPEDTLSSFLETTYAAAADSGRWDRELLEQRPACQCNLPASAQAQRKV